MGTLFDSEDLLGMGVFLDMATLPGQLVYVLAGYLSGCVLYSELFMRLFHGKSLMQVSANHNPGSSNAFIYGGFWCGMLSVACDILKGLVPVWLYCRRFGLSSPLLALVLAAPVLGHARSLLFGFEGGMCIATSFGVFMGLAPACGPLGLLIVLYLGSLLLPGVNNSVRSIWTFTLLPLLCAWGAVAGGISVAAAAGSCLVSLIARKKIWPDLPPADRDRLAILRLPGDER